MMQPAYPEAEVSRVRPSEVRMSRGVQPSGGEHALRRILVCIDSSPLSHACIPHALAIAASVCSEITLVQVLQPARERRGRPMTDVLDWEIERQEAASRLEQLGHELERTTGQPVRTALEQGHPAERITAVARELEADLTVLASHGEHGVAAWGLGSTAQQVLALSRGSVLLVRASAVPQAEVNVKRILVPLDGSLRTESVLPTAERIARKHQAELQLAFVAQNPVPTAVLRSPGDLQLAHELATRVEACGTQYLLGHCDRMARTGVHARAAVLREADERSALLKLARDEHSDLILVSAHGSACNPEQTFGSVTAHLLAYASAPVLVLQDLGRTELGATGHDRFAPTRAPYLEGGA